MGIFLFFAGLGCLIGLAAARAKGLGTAAGLIGGFLLGPLAFLMFLCDGSQKRCPGCSEWVDKTAIICYHCGRELVKRELPRVQIKETKAEEKTVEKKSEEVASERKKCPYCGEMILSEALKCRYCGTFLGVDREMPQVPCVAVDPAYLTCDRKEVYLLCPFCHQKFSAEVAFAATVLECSECKGKFAFLLMEKNVSGKVC
ncbi:MAG: zinc ribbon domain-containing protein [Lentisphaeria bacterium]|nr:zinc ribbon domain-containing protein [Lentisphaeria bacterium]